MMNAIQRNLRRAVMLLLLVGCPVVTGCLALAAAGAAGAGAGYVYYRGKVSQEYPTDFQTTWNATRAALYDLQFPIVRERPGVNGGTIQSETADGAKITVDVELVPSRIPAEGNVTRVSTRVGWLGDTQLSQRILDEIGLRLAQPAAPGSGQPLTRRNPGLGSPRPRVSTPAPPRGREESAEPPRPKARGNLGTGSSWSTPQR